MSKEVNIQNVSQAVYLLFHPSDKEAEKGDEAIVRIAGSKGISFYRTVPIGNPKDFGVENPSKEDFDFFIRIACAVACEDAMSENFDYIFIAYDPNFDFIAEQDIPLGQSIVLGRNCFLTSVENIKYFESGELSFEQILEKEKR